MQTKKYKDAIVYACAIKRSHVIAGTSFHDTSYDLLDREYGWTADDYRRDAERMEQGRYESWLNIKLDALFLGSKKSICITPRESSTLTRTAVMLYRSGNKLFDGGEYGIYDTLEGEKLVKVYSDYSNGRYGLLALAYKDGILYFSGNAVLYIPYGGEDRRLKPRYEIPVLKKIPFPILVKNWKALEALGISPSRARPFKEPFKFTANEREYIVEKELSNHASEIVGVQNGEQILSVNGIILDALGFPEDILLEKIPKLALSGFNKAIKAIDLNKYGLAPLAYYRRGATRDELTQQIAQVYYSRGIPYDKLSQLTKVLSDYTKAIEFDPNFTSAYHNRGALYLRLDRNTEAISDFTKAIQLNPKAADAYCGRGSAYATLRKFEEAKKDLLKALELNPSLKPQVIQISARFRLNLT